MSNFWYKKFEFGHFWQTWLTALILVLFLIYSSYQPVSTKYTTQWVSIDFKLDTGHIWQQIVSRNQVVGGPY